jgi:hypothetical protein
MIRASSLVIALLTLGSGLILSTNPAAAKYGYQCFKDYDRNLYCSCTNFGNHEQASAWIGSVVKARGITMKPGSDNVEDRQRANCTP